MNHRPENLSQVIGQKRIKQVLKTLIISAKKRNESVPHCLFFSGPGMGKTSISRAVAAEMETKILYANGASLKEISDLIPILQQIKSKDILHIDEIHAMKPRVAEFLYTIMEDFEYFTTEGVKKSFPRFTIIGSTTHMGTLPTPLRSRFKYIAEMEPYSEDDLIELLQFYMSKEEFRIEFEPEIARIIVRTCRDTPRILINRAEFIRDFMLANNVKKISRDELIDIIALQDVDENGYRDIDRRYLQLLRENGTMSLRQLASRLNVDEKTLTTDVEPFLFRRGEIEITQKGRKLLPLYNNINEDELM